MVSWFSSLELNEVCDVERRGFATGLDDSRRVKAKARDGKRHLFRFVSGGFGELRSSTRLRHHIQRNLLDTDTDDTEAGAGSHDDGV